MSWLAISWAVTLLLLFDFSFFFLFFLSLLLLLLSFISTRLPPFRKSPIQQWRILTRTRGGSQPSFFFLLLFNIIQTSLAVQLIAASFSLAQGGRRLFAHGSRSWVSNLNFVSSVFDGRFSRQFCQAELNRNDKIWLIKTYRLRRQSTLAYLISLC